MHNFSTCLRTLVRVMAAFCLASATARASVPAAEATFSPAALIIGSAAIMCVLAFLKRRYLMSAIGRAADRDEKAAIANMLGEANYTNLAAFVVPRADNELAHIDHAVLTAAGIVCIRLKQLDGAVAGAVTDPQWTMVAGRRRHNFLNPLIQNEGRVAALRRLLPDVPVASLVVLAGPVAFDTATAANVIGPSALIDWLRDFEQQHAAAHDLDSAWHALRTAARSDADSLRDFHAQLSFG